MTIKHCIDRAIDTIAGMNAAVAENSDNLPNAEALVAGEYEQQLAQAVAMIDLQALPAAPTDQIMNMPVLSDLNVSRQVADQLLERMNPADRLRCMQNNMMPNVVVGSLALITSKLWQNGRTLRIAFLDGHPRVHARVIELAQQWERHANLQLDFLGVDDRPSEIRISFQPSVSWSYIGTDALTVSQNQPTMNFGWLTPNSSDDSYSRVVLHEFGHALGAIHEHQHPNAGIPWDKEAVYQYYGGSPNFWSRDKVDVNLFRKYERNLLNYSVFDPASIMQYPIANELTIGDWEVGWNSTLSLQDQQFMSETYPFNGVRPDGTDAAVTLLLNASPLSAAISSPGEVKRFRFVTDVEGQYIFETSGPTDTMMSVFTADNLEQAVATDDDSGEAWNARVSTVLEPGEYVVHVHHYDASTGTGSFAIRVI